MKRIISFLVASLLLVLMSFSITQSKKAVLERPTQMQHPKDGEQSFYETTILKDRVKNKPWLVVSDRVGNKTNSNKTLEYKDYFYVVNETATEIEIVQANLDNCKIKGSYTNYGWISKKKMLLWTSSLIDPKTRIDRKAFLLNTKNAAVEIVRGNRSRAVKIYNSPNTSTSTEDKNIYEFYFIYKKENDRFLLVKEVSSNFGTIKQNIVGWVQENRLAKWDTRVALEPNFEKDAFDERKANSSKRTLAFSSASGARSHANGSITQGDVLWDNDPVKMNASSIKENRFNGSVIRFPLLENFDDVIYRTGVVGEITIASLGIVMGDIGIIDYAGIKAKVNKRKGARQNINVMLLIDGSTSMKDQKTALSNAVTKIKNSIKDKSKNVKIGAAVYRDYQNGNYLFDIRPVTTSISNTKSFIDNIKFYNGDNKDKREALYYGIRETLKKSNFKKDQTNILIVVGDAGDVSGDGMRVLEGGKVLFDEDDIADLASDMAELDLHTYAIQANNDKTTPHREFTENMKNLILESAKQQYFKFKNISTLTGQNISSPRISENNLIDGATTGKIYTSTTNLSAGVVEKNIDGAVDNVIEFVDELNAKLSKIFDDGASMSEQVSGSFGEVISGEFEKLGLSEEELKKIVKEKYQFYIEAYLAPQISGARNPAYSYVLFMPEYDLAALQKTLDELAQALDKPDSELREALYSTWIELLKQYIGESSTAILENMSFEEIDQKLQGLQKSGLKLNPRKALSKVKLKDIKSKRMISDEEIKTYAVEIVQKRDKIKEIYQQGDNYPFSYKSGKITYFWIPSDLLP